MDLWHSMNHWGIRICLWSNFPRKTLIIFCISKHYSFSDSHFECGWFQRLTAFEGENYMVFHLHLSRAILYRLGCKTWTYLGCKFHALQSLTMDPVNCMQNWEFLVCRNVHHDFWAECLRKRKAFYLVQCYHGRNEHDSCQIVNGTFCFLSRTLWLYRAVEI